MPLQGWFPTNRDPATHRTFRRRATERVVELNVDMVALSNLPCSQSMWMPATLATLLSLSISARTNLSNSSGVLGLCTRP
jgi:hypothetical protein